MKLIGETYTEEELEHTGVAHDENPPGRGSGRFGWGTGKNAYQHYKDWQTRVNRERLENKPYIDPKTGKTYYGDTAIAKRMKMSTTDFRTALEIANEEVRSVDRERAMELRYVNGKNADDGYNLSLDKVAKELGYKNDSSIRALLNEAVAERKSQSKMLADQIKTLVDKNGLYDVGTDAAMALNTSETKLKQALFRLKLQGYEIYGRGYRQVTNVGQKTNTLIIAPPGTPYKDVYDKEIHFFHNENVMVTADGNGIKKAFEYPASFDSKRLMIRYGEEGGKEMDGVVEIRRGVDDCSLKNDAGTDSNYAQVRVLVDGTHYIKGMAVYSDGKGWPDGVDMVFNTNKPSGTPMMGSKDNTVLKPIKKDGENPFGTLIKDHERGGQSYWTDANGEKHLRVINKKSDEGDWDEWSKKLPAQFLSKQPIKLINDQLAVSIADRQAEFDSIRSLTNPTIKRQLLSSFADDCDTTASKLRASPLPGQRYQVILPLRTIKDNEVYAPNFKDGTKLWLIRFPHEGTFQIAECKVNNKQPEGRKVITDKARDAVGISANTAEKMSGADFDGDTVLCIPNNGRFKIESKPILQDLVGFDAKVQYGPASAGGRSYKHLSKDATQNEMGRISNLITDMTVNGAGPKELARAVKYSMTVIDADKHNLDYQRCYKEQNIKELKDTYQGRVNEKGNWSTAAATLITRANSEVDVLKRQGSPRINQKGKPWYDPTKPEGAQIFKITDDLTYEEKKKRVDPKTKEVILDPDTGKPIWDSTGKIKTRTQKSTQMRETDDATKLISPLNSTVEQAYANYANTLKAMANEARKEQVYAGTLKRNPTAAKTYAPEVKRLEDQLKIALANQPLEKQAQYIAGCRLKVLKAEYPNLDKKDTKKKADQYLKDARLQVGAKRHPITITEREWEAIQSGAISDNKLTQILRYADKDRVRELATPRDQKGMSDNKKAQIKSLLRTHTAAQIAEQFGVSVSTIYRIVNE